MNSKLFSRLAAVPYIIWMAIFVIVPLFFIVGYAFTNAEGALTLENFSGLGLYASVFKNSFLQAAIATIVCLLIGYPFAYILTHEPPAVQKIAVLLIMLPMWMNFLLRTYAWMSILENNGFLNQFFNASSCLSHCQILQQGPQLHNKGNLACGENFSNTDRGNERQGYENIRFYVKRSGHANNCL